MWFPYQRLHTFVDRKVVNIIMYVQLIQGKRFFVWHHCAIYGPLHLMYGLQGKRPLAFWSPRDERENSSHLIIQFIMILTYHFSEWQSTSERTSHPSQPQIHDEIMFNYAKSQVSVVLKFRCFPWRLDGPGTLPKANYLWSDWQDV